MDIGGRDIDDWAESGGVFGKDVERFGGSDRAGVACFSKNSSGGGDEFR